MLERETEEAASLHQGQLDFICSSTRVTCVTAGQGGGKTSGAYWWLFSRMQTYPGRGWFIGFPTYKLLDRVVLTPVDPDRDTLVDFLRKRGVNPILHKLNAWIETDIGTILFASAENLTQFEGSHVAGGWIDEFDECPLAAFRRVMERTRMAAGQREHQGRMLGQILLTGTPRHVKWVKEELVQGPLADDCTFVRFPSTANPNYSRAALEEARMMLPRWEFERLYEGRLSDREGGNLFHREWWNYYSLQFNGGLWVAQEK